MTTAEGDEHQAQGAGPGPLGEGQAPGVQAQAQRVGGVGPAVAADGAGCCRCREGRQAVCGVGGAVQGAQDGRVEAGGQAVGIQGHAGAMAGRGGG